MHAAATALVDYLAPTPSIEAPSLSRLLNASVFLKCEFVSPVSSFKARGALVALLRARTRSPLKGAVTSSTGNHGLGVAFAAARLGVPAYVFLPRDPNPDKRGMIEQLGATTVIQGDDIDEAKDLARQFAHSQSLTFIDDGESEDVMDGAATVGLEFARQAPDLDYCFVPMGGGTLAAGVGAAFRAAGQRTSIIAVQSSQAPAMVDSYRARREVERPAQTFAEGLSCRRPPSLALSGLLAFVHEAITVSDTELIQCVGCLLRLPHLLVEPAAAAGLAGAMSQAGRLAQKRVGLVLTGSNVVPDVIRRALASEMPRRSGPG